MGTSIEEEWIGVANNRGIACSLEDMQDLICACPKTLQRSPLYIFFCGVFMGRALSEDVRQVDPVRPPYDGNWLLNDEERENEREGAQERVIQPVESQDFRAQREAEREESRQKEKIRG